MNGRNSVVRLDRPTKRPSGSPGVPPETRSANDWPIRPPHGNGPQRTLKPPSPSRKAPAKNARPSGTRPMVPSETPNAARTKQTTAMRSRIDRAPRFISNLLMRVDGRLCDEPIGEHAKALDLDRYGTSNLHRRDALANDPHTGVISIPTLRQ